MRRAARGARKELADDITNPRETEIALRSVVVTSRAIRPRGKEKRMHLRGGRPRREGPGQHRMRATAAGVEPILEDLDTIFKSQYQRSARIGVEHLHECCHRHGRTVELS